MSAHVASVIVRDMATSKELRGDRKTERKEESGKQQEGEGATEDKESSGKRHHLNHNAKGSQPRPMDKPKETQRSRPTTEQEREKNEKETIREDKTGEDEMKKRGRERK